MFHYAKYIYAVYRERSFSKAASSLFITQPALSVMIKKAETELGLPIFDRSNGLALTPFGVEYIQALQELHGIEDRLNEFIKKTHTLQCGHLALGGSNFSMNYFITQRLAQFHRLYPHIDLDVQNLSTLQTKRLLDLGELDFAFTSCPYNNKKYGQKVCYRECLLLAVPKDFDVNEGLLAHRLDREEMGEAVFFLPKERAVCLKRFAETPFILLSKQNYLRQYTDFLFFEQNISPRIVLELDYSAVSYNFARLGMGATILSNRLVQDDADMLNLYFYKINSAYTIREAYLSFRKNVYFTDAMRKFSNFFLNTDESATTDPIGEKKNEHPGSEPGCPKRNFFSGP